MKLVGADAGVKGAIALLDTEENSLTLLDMPINEDRELDSHSLFSTLLDFSPDWICTEFTFKPISLIRQTGEIMACAKILQVPLEVVAVSRWKTGVLGKNTSDKSVSIKRCQELYPKANLLLTPRCKKPSADRAEAVLLAHWLLLTKGP